MHAVILRVFIHHVPVRLVLWRCLRAQLISEAAESGETTMFFCKIGKDRTGLLAALVLSCCGASDDEIVSDYMRCANI
jgi:hypothetical protein